MAADNPIQVFRSTTALAVPTLGTASTEDNIGYNATDGKLYWLDSSNVVQSFEINITSGLVLLSTATASTSASVDFTSFIDGTYDEYEIHVINVRPATDVVSLGMKVSTDGGTTFKSGATDYEYVTQGLRIDAAVSNANTSNDTKILLHGSSRNLSSTGSRPSNFVIKLFNPASASLWTGIHCVSSYGDTATGSNVGQTSGMFKAPTIVNAIRFEMSSGNILNGEFKLYGVKK